MSVDASRAEISVDAPAIDVELLGYFRVRAADQAIEGIRGSRGRSLVAYLTLHRDRPVPREQLAFLLWPESSDAQALTNLRRELHLLRRALPDPDRLLDMERRSIRWRPDAALTSDTERFLTAVDRGRAGDTRGFEEATRLYRGPLLPTCYDDWIGPERERLGGLYVESVQRLVAHVVERREYGQGMQLLRQLIGSDPLQEWAYSALMRLAEQAGDRAAGLQAYHAAVTNLRRELGVEPDAETRAAYERMLAREADAPRRLGAPEDSSQRGERAPADQPLIGRRGEWATVVDLMRSVADPSPRVLLLRGEAGIGKTRLLEELMRWCRARGIGVAYSRSYAAEGALAYAPIADWLRAPSIRGSVDQLGPVWLSELARVIPELLIDHPVLLPPQPMSEGWQRMRLFEALARAVRAAPTPLLLVLDDVQWADTETLDWLRHLLRDETSSGILVAAGLRAEEQHTNRPLNALLLDLLAQDRLVQVDLAPLGEAETADLARGYLGRDLPAADVARLYRQTEGHPLYVVEVVRGGLRSLDEGSDAWSSVSRLPPRMQAVIAARLEQLSELAREAAEAAATVGRAFTFEVLLRTVDLDETALVHALDELWRRQIVRERGIDAYDFAHDRIREVVYAGMSPLRRRLLHRRVAQALESLNASDPDPVSPDIAAHHEAGGRPSEAVTWYERAALVARRVSANADAVAYLRRAIAIVALLPPSADRDRSELRLQMAIGAPLVAERGYSSGEFGDALSRALALAEGLADRQSVAVALMGLVSAEYVRGELREAERDAMRSIDLAQHHPELLTGCEMSAGGVLTALGRIEESVKHFEAAVRAYQPGRSLAPTGLEPGAFAMCWGSHALWLIGTPGRALARHGEAMEIAASHGPHTLAMAYAYGAILRQLCGDEAEMIDLARAAVELCERYGFAYYGEWGQMLLAWSERTTGGPLGIARIERALASLQSMAARARRPYFLSLLSETHAAAGDRDRARAVLAAALSSAKGNDDRFWEPELHRLLAEAGPTSERQAGLRQALDIADRQGSHSLALRAAMSLGRLGDGFALEPGRVLDRIPADERVTVEAQARRRL